MISELVSDAITRAKDRREGPVALRTRVTVRVTYRAVWVNATHCATAGELVQLGPLDALGIVGTGRAELVDPSDWDVLKTANERAINELARDAKKADRGPGFVGRF